MLRGVQKICTAVCRSEMAKRGEIALEKAAKWVPHLGDFDDVPEFVEL